MNHWSVVTLELASLEATDRLAAAMAASSVQLPMMLALCGPLGAGKTQLVRSLAGHWGIPTDQVTSPTYVLMQRYRSSIDLIHLDFYRLKSVEEAWDLGLDEWLAEPALTVIEWADKFPPAWAEQWVRCDLTLNDRGQRFASFCAQGQRAQDWLDHFYRSASLPTHGHW